MSRCRCCNHSFEEENGWQEFCSRKCAHDYFVTPILSKKRREKAEAEFSKWFADPKHSRLVKNGPRAVPPTFGTMEDITIEEEVIEGKGKNRKVTKRTYTIRKNIGGMMRVRPMTDQERRLAASRRGREGFSDCIVNGNASPGETDQYGLGWYPHD